MRRWIAAPGLIFATLTFGQSSPEPLPVCSVMESLREYANRVVTVIGEFEAGPDQFSLRGFDCKKVFETDGVKWPPAFQLRYVGGPETPATVPFEPDRKSIALFNATVTDM